MGKDKKILSAVSSLDRSKKIFIIFTAAFLGCVMLVGIIFGTVAIAKNSASVMKYKGIYVSDGVANYLTASFKYDFMSALTRNGVNCYDSDYFWQSETDDGQKWGDVLAENTEKYLRRVVVGSYLFDKNTRLTKDDKKVIEKAISEVLDYRAGTDVDTFDTMAKGMGFTYRDFKRAAEMLYKYAMAETVIFGYDGTALSSGLFSDECDGYYESAYSRVKLMFIRTEGDYATDPDTGKQVYSEFDDGKKAEIQGKIEEIRTLIYNTENELEAAWIDEEMFDYYVSKEFGDWNPAANRGGYYFSSESSYSREFADDASEVVSLALSMDVGDYAECEVDIGVCFIYKCTLEDQAYKNTELDHFFSDFYSCASNYVYSASLDVYLDDVTVKSGYDRNAVISIPYNHDLAVKFG